MILVFMPTLPTKTFIEISLPPIRTYSFCIFVCIFISLLLKPLMKTLVQYIFKWIKEHSMLTFINSMHLKSFRTHTLFSEIFQNWRIFHTLSSKIIFLGYSPSSWNNFSLLTKCLKTITVWTNNSNCDSHSPIHIVRVKSLSIDFFPFTFHFA